MDWTQLLLLGINQVAAVVEPYLDYNTREKNKKRPKHSGSAFFRGLCWTIGSVVVHWKIWLLAIPYAFLLAAQYWMTFDYAYNFFSHRPWWYTSNNNFDRILGGKRNRYKKLILKIGCLVASLAFYLIIKKFLI